MSSKTATRGAEAAYDLDAPELLSNGERSGGVVVVDAIVCGRLERRDCTGALVVVASTIERARVRRRRVVLIAEHRNRDPRRIAIVLAEELDTLRDALELAADHLVGAR